MPFPEVAREPRVTETTREYEQGPVLTTEDLVNPIPPGYRDDDPEQVREGAPMTETVRTTCRYRPLPFQEEPVGTDSDGCPVYRVNRYCDREHFVYVGQGQARVLIHRFTVPGIQPESQRLVSVCGEDVRDLGLAHDLTRPTPPPFREGEPYFWVPPSITTRTRHATTPIGETGNRYIQVDMILVRVGPVVVRGCLVCAPYAPGFRTTVYEKDPTSADMDRPVGTPTEERIEGVVQERCFPIPDCGEGRK